MKYLIGAALVLVSPAFSQSPAPPTIRDLSFMSGCWTTPKGAESELRECFTAPYAGLIQGSSQTVKAGKTTQVEFVAVTEKDGKITYAPIFNGKALSVFTLTSVVDKSAVFENPANDFPKKVIYRRNADGSLTARTEGAKPDDPANEEWTMVPQGM
jgi:Domain of unknown function (DUF6265)